MPQLEVFLDNPIITTGSNNMRTKQGNQNRAGNTMEVEQAIEYAAARQDRYLDEIKEFVSIPSIGTNPDYQEYTVKAAQWLQTQ